jgi:hypothetical protein
MQLSGAEADQIEGRARLQALDRLLPGDRAVLAKLQHLTGADLDLVDPQVERG